MRICWLFWVRTFRYNQFVVYHWHFFALLLWPIRIQAELANGHTIKSATHKDQSCRNIMTEV